MRWKKPLGALTSMTFVSPPLPGTVVKWKVTSPSWRMVRVSFRPSSIASEAPSPSAPSPSASSPAPDASAPASSPAPASPSPSSESVPSSPGASSPASSSLAPFSSAEASSPEPSASASVASSPLAPSSIALSSPASSAPSSAASSPASPSASSSEPVSPAASSPAASPSSCPAGASTAPPLSSTGSEIRARPQPAVSSSRATARKVRDARRIERIVRGDGTMGGSPCTASRRQMWVAREPMRCDPRHNGFAASRQSRPANLPPETSPRAGEHHRPSGDLMRPPSSSRCHIVVASRLLGLSTATRHCPSHCSRSLISA